MGKNPLSVLVVEDDLVDFLSVERALTGRHGQDYQLDWAATIEKGKRMLETKHFDAIVLDLGLPDAMGVDSVIHMNANSPSTPIVVLSGAEDLETALNAVQGGAEDFLPKSHLNGRRLDEKIRFAVHRRHVRQRIIRNAVTLEQSYTQSSPEERGDFVKGATHE